MPSFAPLTESSDPIPAPMSQWESGDPKGGDGGKVHATVTETDVFRLKGFTLTLETQDKKAAWEFHTYISLHFKIWIVKKERGKRFPVGKSV